MACFYPIEIFDAAANGELRGFVECQMNRHRLKRRIFKNAQAMLKAGRKLRAFDHPGEYLRDAKPGHNRFFGVDFLAALTHDALPLLPVEPEARNLAFAPV